MDSDETPPPKPARAEPHPRLPNRSDGGRGGPRPNGKGPGPYRPSRPRHAERGRAGADLPGGQVILYGWHPVSEALRNPRRRSRRLLATENGARRLEEALGPLPLPAELVSAHEISRRLEADAVHQGLYLEADHLDPLDFDTLPDESVVLALDQVTDPHNVGAIVRTAAAFGVTAIMTTARHSPSATGVLAKAASGGLEHVPFLIVRNLSDALVELGERGFRRIGLDSDGREPLAAVAVDRPLVLVLGAEGKGLRQRTRDNCDVVARLDLPGTIKSLNVSNATAIALYAVTFARTKPAP